MPIHAVCMHLMAPCHVMLLIQRVGLSTYERINTVLKVASLVCHFFLPGGLSQLLEFGGSNSKPLALLFVLLCKSIRTIQGYPIQKVTEIYNKVTEVYNKGTELENLSWNVLSLLLSELPYIGMGHILP
jgi:hypothetical protein